MGDLCCCEVCGRSLREEGGLGRGVKVVVYQRFSIKYSHVCRACVDRLTAFLRGVKKEL